MAKMDKKITNTKVKALPYSWRLSSKVKSYDKRKELAERVLKDNEKKIEKSISKPSNFSANGASLRAEEKSFFITLEKLGSYLLSAKDVREFERNGGIDYTYHKHSDKLFKRMQREQMEIDGENLVENEFAVENMQTTETVGALYKEWEITDEMLDVTKFPEMAPILKSYMELYAHVKAELKKPPTRLWRYYSNTAYSLELDMQDVISYYMGAAPAPASIRGHARIDYSDSELTDADVLDSLFKVSKPTKVTELFYLYHSFETLVDEAELTTIQYVICRMLMDGYTDEDVTESFNLTMEEFENVYTEIIEILIDTAMDGI
jgi:hypothetical protein